MVNLAAGLLSVLALAGRAAAVGEPCLISNSRLDPNSHKFRSDCGPKDYCAVNDSPYSKDDEHFTTESLVNNESASTLVTTTHRRDLARHHTDFSPFRHETRLSRRGQLQNIFLAAPAPVFANDTLAEEGGSELSNGMGTCQPKTCRKDEFPFG